MNSTIKIILNICACLSLAACTSSAVNSTLDANVAGTQLQKRNYQSRAFATKDKNSTMRAIIATLQDLEFVIDKADATLGSVSATKFTHNAPLKMTISVRSKGEEAMLVRANAEYRLNAVQDPEAYQDFFNSLAKGLFLEAQEVA